MNLGNGASPVQNQLRWGMSAYLGLRVALLMLIPRHINISSSLVTKILESISNHSNVALSFDLETVLKDYFQVATVANANGASLPLNIIAHVDEAQVMLGMTTWHQNEPRTERAAKSLCRVLLDVSMNRQVFFFPYLSGTYPMMSLNLFGPTDYVMKSVTCG